jgi:hypothetical protein
MPKQNQPRHSAYCTRVPYLQCGTLRPTHPGTPCCIRPDVQWWNGTVQCIDLTLTPAAALSPHACAAVPCRRVYGRVAETWQGNLVVQGIKNLADAVSNKVGSVFLEKPATSTSVPSMGVHLCIMAPTASAPAPARVLPPASCLSHLPICAPCVACRSVQLSSRASRPMYHHLRPLQAFLSPHLPLPNITNSSYPLGLWHSPTL